MCHIGNVVQQQQLAMQGQQGANDDDLMVVFAGRRPSENQPYESAGPPMGADGSPWVPNGSPHELLRHYNLLLLSTNLAERRTPYAMFGSSVALRFLTSISLS